MLKVKADKIRYSNVPKDSAQFNEHMRLYYDVMASLYDFLMVIFPFWKTWLASVLPYIQGPRVLEVSFPRDAQREVYCFGSPTGVEVHLIVAAPSAC